MKTSRLLAGLGAAAMAVSSVSAVAAPAANGDVSRSTFESGKKSELGGAGLIIAIIAGVAVIVGIIAAVSDDDDDAVSP